MECFKPLLLLAICGLAYCEVIKTQKCYIPGGQSPNCIVHEVKIDPCPEAAEDKPCKIKLGTNATLSFEYTPNWGTSKAGSQAFKVGTLVDIGFENMDTNGCKYTTCPIEENKRQTYTFALQVEKQFPVTTHQIRWKLWDEEDFHRQCCFKYPLTLIK
ncbi:MD-2-related lipid-recognition protein-like isoform X2 [Macrosteles quadrilineatus]|uniref:MD-2-related lipid-recognition protein-like isoform X2 n=1 Tax=Macrosteles quadrilineatus TaxID=74068 RepID=UPI0023E31E95|nr:MD-2-related lipid-recognition protein-like isoform X2 [Macrosteles quadrilineatus]